MSDEITEAVRQWLVKADMDWTTVEILDSEARSPAEAICFHCQQYVEKLLKAFLTLCQVEAPRTHDLRRLIQLTSPLLQELNVLIDRVDRLSQFGVQIRYPDDWRQVNKEEAREMIELAEEFAAILLPLLKL